MEIHRKILQNMLIHESADRLHKNFASFKWYIRTWVKSKSLIVVVVNNEKYRKSVPSTYYGWDVECEVLIQ